MNTASVKKEKQSAASKASKKLKKNIKVLKGNKNQNEMKKKHKKTSLQRKLPSRSGVIYIGHIPHGFYEDEMKSYFNQFGKVTETALARSKKTGRSKGYGFVEFENKEVAKIAAETMNNYLMFNRIMKCRYIPPEERKRRVARGTISATHYPRQKNRIVTVRKNAKALAKMDQATYLKKVEDKVNQFKRFFEKNGIDFTFNLNNEEPKPEENTPETKKTKKSSNNPEAKSNAEEDEFGVLEIDESDNDISFKTPPKVKKVIKKSLNSPAKSSKKSALIKNIQAKKEKKMNQIKNKKSKKVQENEKAIKKSESKLGTTREKLDRKVKTKVKSAQPVMMKKSSKKEINAVIKQKNLKINKSVGVKESKKKGSGVQVHTIKDKKAKKNIKASIKSKSP